MFGVLPGGGPGPPCVSSVAPVGPPSPPPRLPGAPSGPPRLPPGAPWFALVGLLPPRRFHAIPRGGNIIILYIFPMKTTYFWIAQNDQNDLPEVKRASLGPLLAPPCFT